MSYLKRKVQRGLTLIEVLIVLAVGGIIIAAAIAIGNDVLRGIQAGNIARTIQTKMIPPLLPFIRTLDVSCVHATRDSLPAHNAFQSPLGTAIGAAFPTYVGTAAQIRCSRSRYNQFIRAFTSPPDANEGVTRYDDDTAREWMLRLDASEGLDIGWNLMPTGAAAAGFNAVAGGTLGSFTPPCVVGDASAFILLALEDWDMCEMVSERFTLDPDSIFATACGTHPGATNVDGEAVLAMCVTD